MSSTQVKSTNSDGVDTVGGMGLLSIGGSEGGGGVTKCLSATRNRGLVGGIVVLLVGGVSLVLINGFDVYSGSGTHVGGDRFSDVGSRTVREPTAVGDRLGVFVGYGQSNSDCCGSGPNPEVLSGNSIFNFYAGSNGSTFEYEEPMLGAYCRGSCPYLKVGNGLIEAGEFDEVVFSTAGMPGAPLGSLNEGLEEYPWFGFLVESYLGMKEKYGKVDGILFHQGESNVGLSSTYESEFDLFLENLAAQGIAVGDGVGEAKIYVSRTTKCGAGEDEELSEVQLGLAGKEGVVEGPNTDTISTDTFYRYDGCHFSQAGWDKVAELWMEKLVV